MILNIKTWQTVARRHVSHDIQSLGDRQNGNASKNLEHRAERKRLENERRFSKVILLLLLNLVFFILPQVLIIGIKSVNIWCEFCVTEFEHPNVYLFQVYFFPMFYITSQRPCFTLYLYQSTGNHVALYFFNIEKIENPTVEGLSRLQTSKFSMKSFYVTSFIYQVHVCICNKFYMTSFHDKFYLLV